MDNQIVELNGSLQKEDGKNFTKDERKKVYDSFIEWVESNNFLFAGLLT